MPKIVEYQQQTTPYADKRVRRATGDSFGASVAGGWHAVGESVSSLAGVLQQNEERKDISNLHASLAEARADLTTTLGAAAQQGQVTDTDFVDNFRQAVDDRLGKVQDSITTGAGRDAFNAYSADLRAHFQETTFQLKAAAEGAQAKVNYQSALDQNRNTLVTDPFQFDSIARESDNVLNDPNGPYAAIPATQRAELGQQTKQQLALSAVEGMIRNVDPEAAKKQLNDGKWSKYLDADNTNSLMAMADTAIRAKQVEQDRLQRQADLAAAQMRESVKNDFIAKVQNRTLSAKDVINSELLASEKEHYLNLIKADSEGRATKDDPRVVNDLFHRVYLPDGDPQKIVSADQLLPYFGHGLSWTGLNNLRKEVQDRYSPDGAPLGEARKNFFDAVKPQITRSSMFGRDEKGDEQFYYFQNYVRQREAQYRQSGNNPVDLYDPRSKDYLGSPETVSMFKRTLQQQLNSQADEMRRQGTGTAPEIKWPVQQTQNGTPIPTPPAAAPAPARAPRKSGESVADYLKRTGGG